MAVANRPAVNVGDPNCQLDWDWATKTVDALDARLVPLEARAGTPGYVDFGTIVGGWAAGSGAVTVATAGHVAFTVPITGVYLITLQATAFVTVVNQDCLLDVYVDGNLVDTAHIFMNPINQHTAFLPATFAMPLSAGSHVYGIYVRTSGIGGVASLTSNGSDYCTGSAARVG